MLLYCIRKSGLVLGSRLLWGETYSARDELTQARAYISFPSQSILLSVTEHFFSFPSRLEHENDNSWQKTISTG
jgi:hypothetical protein